MSALQYKLDLEWSSIVPIVEGRFEGAIARNQLD